MIKIILISICVFSSIEAICQDDFLKLVNKELNQQKETIDRLQDDNIRLQNSIDALLARDRIREVELSDALRKYFIASQKLENANDRISDLEEQLNEAYYKYEDLFNENKKLKKKMNSTRAKLVGLSTLGENYANSADRYEDKINVIFIQINKVYIINNARNEAQKGIWGEFDTPEDEKNRIAERRKLNYLSLGVGVGADYAGYVGLNLQSRFGKRVGVGFHLGGGVIPEQSVNASAGFKFFYYKGGYIDFTYVKNIGPLDEYQYNETATASIGWDIFFSRHFGIRASIGGAYVESDTKEVLPIFDFGFNYKF